MDNRVKAENPEWHFGGRPGSGFYGCAQNCSRSGRHPHERQFSTLVSDPRRRDRHGRTPLVHHVRIGWFRWEKRGILAAKAAEDLMAGRQAFLRRRPVGLYGVPHAKDESPRECSPMTFCHNGVGRRARIMLGEWRLTGNGATFCWRQVQRNSLKDV